MGILITACGTSLETGDIVSINVGTECGNDAEIDGYSVADESPFAPVEWQDQSVEGTITRLDDTTITFTSGGIELILTTADRDPICRPFS